MFLGILFLISAIAFLIKIRTSNYKKSPSSKIGYYTIANLSECSDYEIKNNLCKLQLVYSDGKDIYKNNIKSDSNIGDTTVFYEQKNPKSYMVTPSPYLFPGFFYCIGYIILIYAIIRLIIIKSSKDGAAALGGLDALSSITNRHSYLNINTL
jgi:hypothetical protein